MDTGQYRLQVQAEISRNPNEPVFSIELNGRKCWVKTRPYSKKNNWHCLQAFFASLLAMPLFKPTVSSGGAQSLRQEADRLNLMRAKGLAVPEVIMSEDDFLITEDCGLQLQEWIEALTGIEERQYWLKQAIYLLIQVHEAGFAHGRPMPKDMLIRDDNLTLIDLEDDPLQVMSLAEAQARDVWLFMNAATRLLFEDAERTASVFELYQTAASSETRKALHRLVSFVRPFSRLLSKKTISSYMGRDLRQALLANEVMAHVLFS